MKSVWRVWTVFLLVLRPVSTSQAHYKRIVAPVLFIAGFSGIAFWPDIPGHWRAVLFFGAFVSLCFIAAYRLQKQIDDQQVNLRVQVRPQWSACTASLDNLSLLGPHTGLGLAVKMRVRFDNQDLAPVTIRTIAFKLMRRTFTGNQEIEMHQHPLFLEKLKIKYQGNLIDLSEGSLSVAGRSISPEYLIAFIDGYGGDKEARTPRRQFFVRMIMSAQNQPDQIIDLKANWIDRLGEYAPITPVA